MEIDKLAVRMAQRHSGSTARGVVKLNPVLPLCLCAFEPLNHKAFKL